MISFGIIFLNFFLYPLGSSKIYFKSFPTTFNIKKRINLKNNRANNILFTNITRIQSLNFNSQNLLIGFNQFLKDTSFKNKILF